MRYHCGCCGRSVTSELPNDSVIRAFLVCPECIGAERILFPELPSEEFQQNKPDVLISPKIQGVPTKGTTTPANQHGTFTGWDPVKQRWAGGDACTSCGGTGRVEDPQHGHDMRCEPCSGTGRRKR